ncbi:MAG: HAMP domain-containing histidine kinase [Spirochaetaceae bacterium]
MDNITNMDKESLLARLLEKEKLATIGALVPGVTHEINTPLGITITATSLLADKNRNIRRLLESNKLGKKDLMDYITCIEDTTELLTNNLDRASKMVLSFKEISAGQNLKSASVFNICKYCDSIILSLHNEYKNTPHKITFNHTEDINILSFPSAYSTIFTNLIMNSLKHGFNSKEPGIIDIDINKKNNNLIILYSDSGKGIAKEFHDNLYKPFFNTDIKNRCGGLGLNLIHSIITKKLKGKIEFNTTLTNGVKYLITIPLTTNKNIE